MTIEEVSRRTGVSLGLIVQRLRSLPGSTEQAGRASARSDPTLCRCGFYRRCSLIEGR